MVRHLARRTIEELRSLIYRVSHVGPVVGVLALPLLLMRRRHVGLERMLFLAGFGFLLMRTGYRISDGIPCWDFRVFHTAGVTLRAGGDPYGNSHLMLPYPPVSLPFFMVFGAFPFRPAGRVWLAINVALATATIVFCRRVLPADEQPDHPEPLPLAVAVCVLVSEASVFGLDAGTMCAWTTACIYGALWCRSRGQPLLAGVLLAMSAVKIATTIPFLLLFLRKQDRPAWSGICVAGLVLCLLASSPAELIERSLKCLQNIRIMQEPGMTNDYTFDGPYHDDILSFSHWAYCLGLRNSAWINIVQLTLVAGIGALLIYDFYLRPDPPDTMLQYSILCVYASLFLYHRMYDTILLALPLLHCSEQARRESGWRRIAYAAAVVGFLLVLNMPRGETLHGLADWSIGAAMPGRVIQIVVLPYAIWLLALAMLVIRFAARQSHGAYSVTNDRHANHR